MQNPILYQHIKKLFYDLAAGASKFVLAASSNTNESMNNIMASFCPKSNSYSTSESADYRFACAVAFKNLGKNYVLRVLEKLNLSYPKKIVHYCVSAKKKAIKRLSRDSQPHVKALRKLNDLKRKQLKHRTEKNAKDTYCSDMALLDIPVNSENMIKEIENDLMYNTANIAYVFFDLETGGLAPQKDILQIALKSEKKMLSIYLTPSKSIDTRATVVTGLTKNGRQLFLHGDLVATLAHQKAALKVLEYLESFGKKVILIAHNCNFDSDRLVRFFQKLSLLSSFQRVVAGFLDTLSIFRKKFPDRSNHKLCDLGKDLLNISVKNAHNAMVDVDVLERLTVKYIAWVDFSGKEFTVQDVLTRMQMLADEKVCSPTYAPMSSVITKVLIKNLSRHNINFNALVDKSMEGDNRVKEFLTEGENPLVEKTVVVNKIIDYFHDLKNVIENGM